MNACRNCQHYEFILDDDDEIVSESCNAPLPSFIESALLHLDGGPEDYWEPVKAGEFCKAFQEAGL
jgi:hypothetical protein